jgi:tetratricopeptide (TPR) repeat protein
MFDHPPPKRGFTTHFHCLACGHNFRRDVRRIYVHWPTFEQRVLHHKDTGRSEFVIPQRIACPKCGAIDRYEFAPYTRNMLSMTMTVAMLAGLAKDHPVKIITFTLHDGTIMHPLDGLKWYWARVENAPNDLQTRMRYGNVLRTLGYLDEAEAEYQLILDRDAGQLEAWKSLASIHMARKHPGAAKKALKELVAHAPQSSLANREDWSAEAQAYLDGVYPLEELSPDAILMASQIEPEAARPKKHGRRRRRR